MSLDKLIILFTSQNNLPAWELRTCNKTISLDSNNRQSLREFLYFFSQDSVAYAVSCAAIIEEEVSKKSAARTPVKVTPYRPSTSSTRTPGWSPRDSTIPIDLGTPIVDSRKVSIKQRLERLEAYGEAPKLPSLVLRNSSANLSAPFRSPVTPPVAKP